VHACNLRYDRKCKIGGPKSRLPWAKSERNLISKITRAKGARDMTQVLEHLPNKCEVLSSTPFFFVKKKVPSQKKTNKIKCNLGLDLNKDFF
jgi:hypothetical protein